MIRIFNYRFPSTRLGRVARANARKEAMEHCSIFYDKKVPEYFFDRNPANFSAILGKLRKFFFLFETFFLEQMLQSFLRTHEWTF